MTPIIAIDFGTSNSTVGVPDESGPRLLALESGQPTIPSAIFFNLEEQRVQFGREAIAAYTSHYEGRLLRALKSTLGSALIEEATQVGPDRIHLKDILGRFLGHLKGIAEKAIGQPIQDVVIGRPVWFVDDDPQRDALAENQLRRIAAKAGFRNIHFQFEPIAAALDYESTIDHEELALIADLGGGTCDFSVVRVSPQRRRQLDRKADVLANTGVHVGGTDFDKYLSLSQVMPHLGYRTAQRVRPELELPSGPYFDLATWHRIVFLNSRQSLATVKEMKLLAAQPELLHRLVRVVREQTGHQLAGEVERAKIALSDLPETTLSLPFVDDSLNIRVSQSGFLEATLSQTRKISDSILECLRMAGVEADAIDTLFLTGGTSAIPFVAQCCKAAVPTAKLIAGDRFGSVGLGLTIDAGARCGVDGAWN